MRNRRGDSYSMKLLIAIPALNEEAVSSRSSSDACSLAKNRRHIARDGQVEIHRGGDSSTTVIR